MNAAPIGRVLVTGASGFVGSHVVHLLLDLGTTVRCLLRRESSTRFLPVDRIERVDARFDDPGSLERAVADCDTVVHAAGAISAPTEEDYLAINAAGTENLLRACRRSGAARRRFVLISSLAAAGPSSPDRARVESDEEDPVSAYGRSKLAGERAVHRCDLAEVPWTILRPPAVYGPRDVAFLELAKMVRRGWVARRGGPAQRLSLVHVRDLAAAIADVCTHETAVGQTYFAAAAASTHWDEIAAHMGRAMGRSFRTVGIPPAVLPLATEFLGFAARVRGQREPVPTDRRGDLLAPAWVCTSDHIREDVGWEAGIAHAEGWRETIDWYLEQGWLAR